MRILLAEDDPVLASQLADELVGAGYVVDAAANGVDAHHLGEAKFVSGAHVFFTCVNGRLTVRDLDSRNGTRVNAVRVDAQQEVAQAVLALDFVRNATGGNPPRKLIIVPQRIVNVVI